MLGALKKWVAGRVVIVLQLHILGHGERVGNPAPVQMPPTNGIAPASGNGQARQAFDPTAPLSSSMLPSTSRRLDSASGGYELQGFWCLKPEDIGS